jgi:RNA polymerase sigma factor (sigma-70 family)
MDHHRQTNGSSLDGTQGKTLDPIPQTHKYMDQDQTRHLIRKSQAGDLSARGSLVNSHLPLVFHLAKRYYHPGLFMELEDLVQQGCLGLLKAVEMFDLKRRTEGRKIRFSTYAVYWIKHMIRREIESRGLMIAVPPNVLHLVRLLEKSINDTRSYRGKSPNLNALSASLRVSPKRLDVLREAVCEIVPLEILSDEDNPFQRTLPSTGPDKEDPERTVSEGHDREALQRIVSTLPKRERYVVQHYYGLIAGKPAKTYYQIGKDLGVSMEWVRTIRNRALRRLRENYGIPEKEANASLLSNTPRRRWTASYHGVIPEISTGKKRSRRSHSEFGCFLPRSQEIAAAAHSRNQSTKTELSVNVGV